MLKQIIENEVKYFCFLSKTFPIFSSFYENLQTFVWHVSLDPGRDYKSIKIDEVGLQKVFNNLRKLLNAIDGLQKLGLSVEIVLEYGKVLN